jgi:ABC-type transport system involved in Fe-S cluster assembly fused permease/ATPase subunit
MFLPTYISLTHSPLQGQNISDVRSWSLVAALNLSASRLKIFGTPVQSWKNMSWRFFFFFFFLVACFFCFFFVVACWNDTRPNFKLTIERINGHSVQSKLLEFNTVRYYFIVLYMIRNNCFDLTFNNLSQHYLLKFTLQHYIRRFQKKILFPGGIRTQILWPNRSLSKFFLPKITY